VCVQHRGIAQADGERCPDGDDPEVGSNSGATHRSREAVARSLHRSPASQCWLIAQRRLPHVVAADLSVDLNQSPNVRWRACHGSSQVTKAAAIGHDCSTGADHPPGADRGTRGRHLPFGSVCHGRRVASSRATTNSRSSDRRQRRCNGTECHSTGTRPAHRSSLTRIHVHCLPILLERARESVRRRALHRLQHQRWIRQVHGRECILLLSWF